MPEYGSRSRPTGLAIWLVVAGVIGWFAAFQLTLDKFIQLENPDANLTCDFSVLVQCGANLASWQGEVFGFPNPVIGLTGWVAPIVVGVALLAGARFARWFWLLFWAGHVFAIGFVCWLIYQSIFNLGTLCPWCMVTWSVTIPTFFAVTVHLLRTGVFPFGARGRRLGRALMPWVPLMAFGGYVVIAVIAQLRLDVIGSLL